MLTHQCTHTQTHTDIRSIWHKAAVSTDTTHAWMGTQSPVRHCWTKDAGWTYTHTRPTHGVKRKCVLSLGWICVLNKDLPCFSVLVSLADNRAAQCTCQPKLPSNNCLLYQGGPEDVTVNSLSSLTQPFCIGRNGGRKRMEEEMAAYHSAVLDCPFSCHSHVNQSPRASQKEMGHVGDSR